MEAVSALSNDVEAVISTRELATRPSRLPDYETENQALLELARAMTASPEAVLQKLSDTALQLCGADSAGISLEEEDRAGGTQFRWRAVSGQFKPLIWNTLPRNFSPCGVVLDRNAAQLMTNPVAYYTYLKDVKPQVVEVLLSPFYKNDQPIGTVWVVSHTPGKVFDAEDERLVKSLSLFAAAAVESLLKNRELNDKSQRLEAALEAGAISTWMWDIINDRVFADRNLAALFKVSEAEAQGGAIDCYLKAVHPNDLAEVSTSISQALAAGDRYEQDYRIISKDDSVRWVTARGRIVRDEAGNAVQMPGVIVDITERKQAENELHTSEEQREELLRRELAARQEAEAANQAKDLFLGLVAHDLRGPVNSILGWARLLQMGNLSESKAINAMEIIARNAQSQSRMIDDLLDLTSIVRGELRLETKRLNLIPIFLGAVEMILPHAEEKNIKIDMSLPTTEMFVMGDVERLQQVIWNLLSNAVKFTPEGGSINLEVSNQKTNVEIRLTDTGQGISPEFLPHIFERYSQAAPNRTLGARGLGLGLYITSQIVRAHQGTIQAESKGAKTGSTFIIRLPELPRSHWIEG